MSEPCGESSPTGEKRAYECPVVVPLGSLEDGQGAACAPGSTASGPCNGGSAPGAQFGCRNGTVAASCNPGHGGGE